jgi:hypothetical protein
MILHPDQSLAWLDIVIARHSRLVRDLQRIQAGDAPTDLHAAPLITDFMPALRGAPCLRGRIIGHPRIRGDDAITSDLIVLAPTRAGPDPCRGSTGLATRASRISCHPASDA